MKKVVCITGTSTGVGLEAACMFAQKGYTVYATMRNLAKATELKARIAAQDLDIQILPLDVTQPDTIDRAVQQIYAEAGKIDILLNNAGAGFARTLEQCEASDIQKVTEVNYYGVIYMIQAVLPHMRAAKAGHIINVTSVGGLVGQPFNELYCGAKFAVEGLTEALASYVTPSFGVHFSLVEPGGISTAFMQNAVRNTADASGALNQGAYQAIFERYLAGSQARAKSSDTPIYQTTEAVAAVILEVAQMTQPPLRIRTSDWAEQFCALKTEADPDGLKLLQKVQAAFL